MALLEDKSRAAVLQRKPAPFRDRASTEAGVITLDVTAGVTPLVDDYFIIKIDSIALAAHILT